MSKKTKLYIMAYIAIVIVVIGAYMVTRTKKERYFNKIELVNRTSIRNQTNMPYIDTILRVGFEHLSIEPNIITVKVLKKGIFEKGLDNLDVRAYVYGHDGTYVLFIRETDRAEALVIIAHELIHIKQYSDKRLQATSDKIKWIHHIYTVETLPIYDDRPWEIEAFKKMWPMHSHITGILYDK